MPLQERLHSLDQYRGYTVAAMFAVNWRRTVGRAHGLFVFGGLSWLRALRQHAVRAVSPEP